MFDPKSYYQDGAVAAGYDRSRFRTVRGRLFKFLRDRLLEKVDDEFRLDSPVLDIACGTGLITGWHVTKGRSAVAGDISGEMLEHAKAKFQRADSARFVRFDAKSLPFKDKSFDSVTCFRFLNLVRPEIRKVIHREIARVCRRYALLSFSADSRYQQARGAFKRIVGYGREQGSPATVEALQKELSAAGMQWIRHEMVIWTLSSEVIVLAKVKDEG
jgi:ubiquinone/menaquinone biosynthesis C-methylase UbiE